MKRRGKGKFALSKAFSNLGSGAFTIFFRAIPPAIFAGVLIFILLQVRNFLYADSYFQAATIKVFPRGILSPVEYAKLEHECRGRNLLTLNLRRLEKLITANPEVKEAKIERKLPREIEVFVIPRKPAVELSVSPKGEYYTVDQDGVVMAVNRVPNQKLIQWSHYNYRQKKFSVFDSYTDLSLKQLPTIIRAFQENDATKNEKISAISVDHLGEYTVKVLNGPEFRICDDPAQALKKVLAMGDLLQGQDRDNILYMNLCLKDVVVQYKTK